MYNATWSLAVSVLTEYVDYVVKVFFFFLDSLIKIQDELLYNRLSLNVDLGCGGINILSSLQR